MSWQTEVFTIKDLLTKKEVKPNIPPFIKGNHIIRVCSLLIYVNPNLHSTLPNAVGLPKKLLKKRYSNYYMKWTFFINSAKIVCFTIFQGNHELSRKASKETSSIRRLSG